MKNYDELLSEFPDPEHTDFTKMGSGYLIINVLSRVAQCLTEETDEEFDDNSDKAHLLLKALQKEIYKWNQYLLMQLRDERKDYDLLDRPINNSN